MVISGNLPGQIFISTFQKYAFLLLVSSLLNTVYTTDSYAHTFEDYDVKTIREELTSTPNIVEMRFTKEVESYIRTYLVNSRSKGNAIVNRMMKYFPLIEKKLEEHNLPEELKYLAIVESALDPKARSRSGALGLWQFMSPTARDFGLRMYHSVDERMDPYRSTDAALTYLARLYDRFGDWELALAAYNAGPGRVGRTMDRTNKTDYWSLREDLPRETANYIPAFIAACYIFSEFDKHGFVPERAHPDFHFTTKVEIYNHKVYLNDVARLMHIDIDRLKDINPMYKRNYIPESPHGYNLILPNRCLTYFERLQDTLERSEFVRLSQLTSMPAFQQMTTDSLDDVYLNTTYIVQYKENLFSVANLFDLDILQLKYWNMLPSLHVDHGMLVDLPIPMMSGKFLISDYKTIKTTSRLPLEETGEVQYDVHKLRHHQLAESYCDLARKEFQKTDFKKKNSIYSLKGIPSSTRFTTGAKVDDANPQHQPGHSVTAVN